MRIDDVSIALVGATGTVGEALAARLGESGLGARVERAYASRGARVDSVDIGGRSVRVEPLPEIGDATIDLAFVTLPPSIGAKVAPAMAARGAVVIDVGNSLAGASDAPLALPGVSMPDAKEVGLHNLVRTPSAAGWMVARACAPLRDLGLRAVSGVVSLPASAWGRKAVEELSEQVVASFNLKDPPRRIFAEGLAFDTVLDDADEGEWTSLEDLAAAEVQALTGVEQVGVQIVTQPLFAGATAGLHLRGEGLDVDRVDAALRDVPGLRPVQARSALRPRKAIGKKSVFWGALRADRDGDGVHLWLVADPSTGAGADVPVQVAEWVLGHLPDREDA